MKAKSVLLSCLLLVLLLAVPGCSSQNPGLTLSLTGDEYRISETDEKIVFVFPYTQGDDEAENVVAQSLSDDEADAVRFDDNDGVFMADLDIGTYEIEVSCTGYETATRILVVDENNLYVLGVELNML